ncbi:hypothetical protein [Anoxynatronum buryatiense]|uniref:Uncharacterized protein n=1 Tax=Anoxynatronum buryatiense TaxID=489973 RepID=A0AA45WWA2_9CLOT|nr:hypothetical protein [Anoxynatronum buryatiense]SMP57894.1 hypothetical protein SAMN06296020_10713 [Anoxynatronum buryatiense]
MSEMKKWLELKEKLENSEALLLTLMEQERPEGVQLLLEGEGMTFTLKEIELLREALLQSVHFTEGELSDEALNEVGGGYVLSGISTLFDPSTRKFDSALNSPQFISMAKAALKSRW